MDFLRLFLEFTQKFKFTIISFFQKLIKGSVGKKAGRGRVDEFSKINKWDGRLFSTREYYNFCVLWYTFRQVSLKPAHNL